MWGDVAALWRRVASEQQRAARAGALAAGYAARSAEGPESFRPLYARMAELQRRIEARHRTSADIHELHARRLAAWLDRPGASALRPVFMAAIASTMGTASATATLRGQRRGTRVVAVSDAVGRAASDLEIVTGEGPATEAARNDTLVSAAGRTLRDRWPQFGPAIADLGILAVIAVPMRLDASRLGVLCAYNREPVIGGHTIEAAGRIAEALTHSLLAGGAGAPEDATPLVPVVEEADYQAVVHQAAGMVSVQCECAVGDAEALLRAHAFAEDQPVEEVARRIVRGSLRLC
ncbi:MAG TPA: GAF domain-containing protein [Streptosporangiaceae bacterium]|nr:GAF domain-containing protein [Streptosporangiaceae bacterium]